MFEPNASKKLRMRRPSKAFVPEALCSGPRRLGRPRILFAVLSGTPVPNSSTNSLHYGSHVLRCEHWRRTFCLIVAILRSAIVQHSRTEQGVH